MSTFFVETASCPRCQHAQEVGVAYSVNAARSPHLRDAILSGEFQQIACNACGGRFLPERPFLYIDGGRHHWIGVFPGSDSDQWLRCEVEVTRAWQQACGDEAPAVAREIGAGMKLRTVFGLAALREKLICDEHGLDDGLLEVVKLRVGLAPSSRLGAVDAADLTFVDDGRIVRLPRAAYDETATQATEWNPLLAELREGTFVDLARLRD